MKLSKQQRKRFKEALLDAFPSQSRLRQLINLGLDENLEAIVGGESLDDIIFNLVVWAESQGRLQELIAAAAEANPGNEILRKFLEGIGFCPRTGELESIVLSKENFSDVEGWRSTMAMREQAVCRLESDNGIGVGTGFLIGRDSILTNFHVIKGLLPAQSAAKPMRARFNYKLLTDGSVSTGEVYSLRTDVEWLAASSPVELLDYAVLRFNELPDLPCSIRQSYRLSDRGKIELKACDVPTGSPLFILQHPSANPLKFSVGTVLEIDSIRNRIVYTANTLPGSSGSPCFLSDWRIAAIHHYGSEYPGNRGVLISSLIADLRSKNLKILEGWE